VSGSEGQVIPKPTLELTLRSAHFERRISIFLFGTD